MLGNILAPGSGLVAQHVIKFHGSFLLRLHIQSLNPIYSLRNTDHQLIAPVTVPVQQVHHLIVRTSVDVYIRRVFDFNPGRIHTAEVDFQILILRPERNALPFLAIQIIGSGTIHFHGKLVSPVSIHFTGVDNGLVKTVPFHNLHVKLIVRELHLPLDCNLFLRRRRGTGSQKHCDKKCQTTFHLFHFSIISNYTFSLFQP